MATQNGINVPTEKKIVFKGSQDRTPRVIFVIENAFLENVKIKGQTHLLNFDDHKNLMHKAGKDATNARPDILHQTLLAIYDSPLAKAGKIEVFIHTHKNDLIYVDPAIRLPRTFQRFCGLMSQLLINRSVHASGSESNKKLLTMIKNPITDHLPPNIRKIALSKSWNSVKLDKFIGEELDDSPVCFIIGGFAHGQLDIDYEDERISVADYPLSAAACASRVCHSFEMKWDL